MKTHWLHISLYQSASIMVDIEVPICQGTYSTASLKDLREMSFLNAVHKAINDQRHEYLPFFLGLCYQCWAPRYISGYIYDQESCDLLRCGGCQLVAYCSRECQKNNWSKHKYVCKQFPVVSGKNVLYTKGSWQKHIANLRKQADQIPYAKPIFHNPRVCRTCKDASQEHLTDCACMNVSYCSKKCSKADKQHQKNCKDLLHISQVYSIKDIESFVQDVPDVRLETLCNKFEPVSSCNNILSDDYDWIFQKLTDPNFKDAGDLEDSLIKERLSYPMSLLYALQSLPGHHMTCSGPPLEALTTLVVHIVTSITLYDSEPWEVFMHRLPKLNQLNIVYINQERYFRQSFGLLRSSFRLRRCDDCECDSRVINYFVHQMPYHMFFSSPEYTKPDVVVVYGNEHEMSTTEDDCIHREISYRNMIHSRDTVLVLMDTTQDQVIKGIKSVNAVQSVDQLVPTKQNPLRGFSSNRAEVGSDSDIINEKCYFTCLRS